MNGKILKEKQFQDLSGNVHIHFLDYLLNIEAKLLDHAYRNIPAPILSLEERETLMNEQSNNCIYCEKFLFSTTEKSVLDHCHYVSCSTD